MRTQSTQSPERKLLVLEIASRHIALPIESIREIVPIAALARLPAQPLVLEGFLNLRGSVISVLRLARLLDLPESEPGLYTPVAVLQADGGDFAVLADKAIDITSVPAGALTPVEEHASFNSCAKAQVELNGRVVAVLSPERLLLEKERQSVADFQARMARRLASLEAVEE
jgi:purine-binding chemotaxis protein CheW